MPHRSGPRNGTADSDPAYRIPSFANVQINRPMFPKTKNPTDNRNQSFALRSHAADPRIAAGTIKVNCAPHQRHSGADVPGQFRG